MFIPRIWLVTAGPVLDSFTVTVAFAVVDPVTVSPMAVVAVNVPEIPVTVIVEVPTVVVLLVDSVSTLVPVVGLVANAAVTPVGRPDAARVTLPAKGDMSVTVIVSVPLAP
jgi:hypothetical protein